MNIPILLDFIEAELRYSFLELGYKRFQNAMSWEISLLVAERLLKLKEELTDLQLICFRPYENQANNLPRRWRERYYDVLAQADEVYCLQGRYTPECFAHCNWVMLECSSRLIAVYDHKSHGEIGHIVESARMQRIDTVIIEPYT